MPVKKTLDAHLSRILADQLSQARTVSLCFYGCAGTEWFDRLINFGFLDQNQAFKLNLLLQEVGEEITAVE